ncbi:5-dehydro-4-deoxyglucarate dehydratase [Actinomadura nitritigenes]|uniref:5-dehydro-4-deoxyglucarate dehydratase n=1 Tax=Actinomadura nitritigenes TaxID=134602 RepID=UPI003D8A5581
MDRLAEKLRQGLLYFPVTPFSGHDVDADALREQIRARLPRGPGAVFAACGTGEFSALGTREFDTAVAAAVAEVDGAVPVLAGAGYSSALAVEFARRAADAGADGVLVFPPSGDRFEQEGLYRHYAAIAQASPLPIILYQRGAASLTAATAARLAELPQIIGLKDGLGNLENMARIRRSVGDRWSYFNGMPTAELSVAAFTAIGVPAYSSAAFAFLPEVATRFFAATRAGDQAICEALIDQFYAPFAEIRDRRAGYAVSLVKAGLRLRGFETGTTQPPLTDPQPADLDDLAELIESALRAVEA